MSDPVDALSEEFWKLPHTATYAFFTETDTGITFLSDKLRAIFIVFMAQLFTPDITTYRSTCNDLVSVLDLALLTAENCQLVSDILELADVIFENFVSIFLTLQEGFDPQYLVPTHSISRMRLIDIIDQALMSPHDLNDIRSQLQTLKSRIQQREHQMKADLLASDPQWIYDLAEIWPEFEALNRRGTFTRPTSVLPATTTQLGWNSSMTMEDPRASESTRLQRAFQHLTTLPTTASRPIKDFLKRGDSHVRVQSLCAMLPPEVYARVLVTLATVTEADMEVY